MKLPLLLCLLSIVAGHARPGENDPTAAERDPVLKKLLANYAAIDPDAGVGPFGPTPAPPQRPANPTPVGETGAYFGTHHPFPGAVWLGTLGRTGMREEAVPFGEAVITRHPEIVLPLYDRLASTELKSYYLDGLLAGPRANLDPVRAQLWARAERDPSERDVIVLTLIREEVRSDPAAAWAHLQRLGYTTPEFILTSFDGKDPRVPFPVPLLDLISDLGSRVSFAEGGIGQCGSAENLAPLERWLEQAPPSLDTLELCIAMARQQARVGRFESARHWADHLIHPKTRAAVLQEIHEIRAQAPAENRPAGKDADATTAVIPDDGLWHNGLAVRRGDPELQRLTAAFDAQADDATAGVEPCRALAKYYASRHPEAGIAWLGSFPEAEYAWLTLATAEFVRELGTRDAARAFELYARCSNARLRVLYLKNLALLDPARRDEVWQLAKLLTGGEVRWAIRELVAVDLATDPLMAWERYRKYSKPGTTLEKFFEDQSISRVVPYPAVLLGLFPQKDRDRMAQQHIDGIVRRASWEPNAGELLQPMVDWLLAEPLVPSNRAIALYLAHAYKKIGDAATSDRLTERFQP